MDLSIQYNPDTRTFKITRESTPLYYLVFLDEELDDLIALLHRTELEKVLNHAKAEPS